MKFTWLTHFATAQVFLWTLRVSFDKYAGPDTPVFVDGIGASAGTTMTNNIYSTGAWVAEDQGPVSI